VGNDFEVCVMKRFRDGTNDGMSAVRVPCDVLVLRFRGLARHNGASD